MRDAQSHASPEASRRALVLLSIGALSGVALAAVGALRPTSDALPPDAIARVNDRVIRSESYERVLQMVASDKRNPMGDADRARVLKRMIEEELLIQRGEAIGLVESDPAVRKSISAAMIQFIVAESEAFAPDEEALRSFYQENARYFAPPGALHVRQLVFEARPGEAPAQVRDRARAARAAIAEGLAFSDARERYGDTPRLAIPDAPLPPHKLAQYVGPTVVERVRTLQPLEVSELIESGVGVRIFQLLEASADEAPAFEAIRDRVEHAFRRDAADRALRDALERLWREADIVMAVEGVD